MAHDCVKTCAHCKRHDAVVRCLRYHSLSRDIQILRGIASFTFLCGGYDFSTGIRQLAAQRHQSRTAQRHKRGFMPTHGGSAFQAVPAISAGSDVEQGTVACHISTDNDPLYRFHRWLANLHALDVD